MQTSTPARATALLIALVLLLAVRSVSAADDAINVAGAIAKPGDWSVARLKSDLAADVTSIDYTGHDGKHTSNAVPLVSLLKAAGLQTNLVQPQKNLDPKQKHAEMRYVVIVEGQDGYSAVFSIAELMPDLGNRHIYLALDVDGKPWPEKESPLKLVASDDAKPARWVHNVKTITVVKVKPPTTQPTK